MKRYGRGLSSCCCSTRNRVVAYRKGLSLLPDRGARINRICGLAIADVDPNSIGGALFRRVLDARRVETFKPGIVKRFYCSFYKKLPIFRAFTLIGAV